jgi:hypothetical protein
MRPHVTYASIDRLAASQLMRELESQCDPRPELGLWILGAYLLALGAFVAWVLA